MRLRRAVTPYLQRITRQQSVHFSIEKMAGDASSREYFRLHILNHPQLRSLVLMRFNPGDAFRSDEAGNGDDSADFPFTNVQRFLDRGGLPVPKIFHASVSRGLIFLEDLGDVQLFSKVHDAGRDIRLDWYRRALDLLVQFQTHGESVQADCLAFSRRFDYDLLMWEFDHYVEYGIEALYDITVPDDDRRLMTVHFDRICRLLVELPTGLVHRDFQSRNIMVHKGDLSLIDFQDALIGPWPYDLVALLRDSYIALEGDLVDELVDAYLDRWEIAKGITVDRDAFKMGFRMQTVQRKLKDAGRFVFIDRVKHNPSFLGYIPDSLSYVRWALKGLPEFHDLAELLSRYEARLSL